MGQSENIGLLAQDILPLPSPIYVLPYQQFYSHLQEVAMESGSWTGPGNCGRFKDSLQLVHSALGDEKDE